MLYDICLANCVQLWNAFFTVHSYNVENAIFIICELVLKEFCSYAEIFYPHMWAPGFSENKFKIV